jgi:putative alpha-1,2-mannosidase
MHGTFQLVCFIIVVCVTLFLPIGAIKLMGGRDAYLHRLNIYFNNDLFFPANEPGFLIPYLYNYVGRPDLTAKTVHKIIRSNYENSIKGIPGNDDAGALGSFFMFCSLGMLA